MKVDAGAWTKWRAWMEKIRSDLENVVNDQAVFNGFREIVQENGDRIDSLGGGLFVDLIKRNYAAAAFMGIRRQLKDNTDSVSLVRLLSQVAEVAGQITYECYLEAFPLKQGKPEWQRWTFDQLSTDQKIVSGDRIRSDIAEVKQLNLQIEEIADRTVAHLDKRGTAVTVSFDDLATSIDTFNRLTCKYIAFFTSEGWGSLQASILFNWKDIFHHPWVRPG